MIGERALGWHPHDRLALGEDHAAAFLDVVVGEELIEPVDVVPHVQNHQLARGAIVLARGHVNHVAQVAQRAGGGHALRIAGGGVVDAAGGFHGGRLQLAADRQQILGGVFFGCHSGLL